MQKRSSISFVYVCFVLFLYFLVHLVCFLLVVFISSSDPLFLTPRFTIQIKSLKTEHIMFSTVLFIVCFLRDWFTLLEEGGGGGCSVG